MTVYFTSTEKIWGKNHFKCPNLILNYSKLRFGFTQTSPRLHFSFFIFRALKPCDQDSPISVCNGNQSTSYPARSQHEWPWMARKGGRFNSPIHSFIGMENTPFLKEKPLRIPDHFCGWLKLKKKPEFSKNKQEFNNWIAWTGGSGVKTRCKF